MQNLKGKYTEKRENIWKEKPSDLSFKAISDHDHGTKWRGMEGRSYNLRLAGRGGHLGRVQLFPGPKPHAELATADNKLSFGQFP